MYKKNKIYVGNLPFTASEEDIKNKFEAAGKIDNVKLINDFQTGKSKGFAFIEYAQESSATQAIKDFNQTKFDESSDNNNILKVDYARDKVKKPFEHKYNKRY